MPKDTDVGLGQISGQMGDSPGDDRFESVVTGDPPCESKIEFAGLMPPTLDSTGGYVTGADKAKHQIDNK